MQHLFIRASYNFRKYLVPIIDSNLSWTEQIVSVEKKIFQGFHALFEPLSVSDINNLISRCNADLG